MRDLLSSDLPALSALLAACGAFTEAEVACALELLDTVLADPRQQDYRVAVAERHGVAAGYVLWGPVPLTEGTYDIYWIAVAPDCQGLGLGRRLLAHAEGAIRAAAGRLICLETSSQGDYRRTRDFYRQAGYRAESRIRDFYRPGDDRLTFVKRFFCRENS